MKRINYFLVLIIMFFTLSFSVKADNIERIDMNIYINENGDANVVEKWTAKADSGSEWYRTFENMANQQVDNFKVYMDEKEYAFKENWNVKESMSAKAGYYGFNKISNGFELCFGKSDLKKHTFTIKYDISNFVYDIGDEQIIDEKIWSGVTIKNFEITIHSYYSFPDTLDVWGYGYQGLAYVYNGEIKLSNEVKLNDEDVVVLVRFKEKKFNTNNNIFPNADTFDEALELANKGSVKYDPNKKSAIEYFFEILFYIFEIALFVGIPILIAIFAKNGGSKIKNKVYPKKDVLSFRDLPFKDDYARAYLIADEYRLMKQKTDYLGAVILKWIKDENVRVTTEEKGIFKNKETKIEFVKAPVESNELDLYNMMKTAAKDDILEKNEFKRYCSNHYSKVLGWFDSVESSEYSKLKYDPKYINKVMTKGAFGREKEVMGATDELNEKASHMAGLKKFFKEFDNMSDKTSIEVKMWREYLIYAQIFGMAKEVAKEFKNLYPDVITDDMYNNVILIHDFSYASVSAASAARSRAESYSSGGGGFSSSGGGGGSIGGGSFGGR